MKNLLILFSIFGLITPTFSCNAKGPAPTQQVVSDDGARFSTEDHKKSKGVYYSLVFPKSWKASESDDDRVVQKFISENGQGTDLFLLIIKDLPAGITVTKADIKSLYSKDGLSSFVPDDAKIITTTPYKIGSVSAGIIEYIRRREKKGYVINTQVISLIIIQEKNVLQFQLESAALAADAEQLKKKFDSLRPTFHQIIDSITFNKDRK